MTLIFCSLQFAVPTGLVTPGVPITTVTPSPPRKRRRMPIDQNTKLRDDVIKHNVDTGGLETLCERVSRMRNNGGPRRARRSAPPPPPPPPPHSPIYASFCLNKMRSEGQNNYFHFKIFFIYFGTPRFYSEPPLFQAVGFQLLSKSRSSKTMAVVNSQLQSLSRLVKSI